jgi:hypothetical protein
MSRLAGRAAQTRYFREMFDSFVTGSAAPSPPKPEPLAVIASRLPMAEVLARLNEIQAKYPEAEVRRGNANRWEVWPGSATNATTSAGSSGEDATRRSGLGTT